MLTVRDLLNQKETQVHTISPDETAYNALLQMAEANIGALLVMEGDSLRGIFSERDYARKVALRNRSSRNTPVSELMSPDPVCIVPATSVHECMELMTNKRLRHLPVEVENHIVGVISIGDVVRAIISDQRVTIENLEGYIHGTALGG
ncbi:MAG: CBS domain-containing protein [Opitutales bacterium]